MSLEAKKATIKALMVALKKARVDGGTALTISLMLNQPGEAEQLMAWMDLNPEATVEEICDKTGEIHDLSRPSKRSPG